MQAQKFKDCIVWKHRLKLFNREILGIRFGISINEIFNLRRVYDRTSNFSAKHLIFSRLFGNRIERSLTNLLRTALPIQETRKKIPLFV